MPAPRIRLRTIMMVVAAMACAFAAAVQLDLRHWWHWNVLLWWASFRYWTLPYLLTIFIGSSIALAAPMLVLVFVPRTRRSLWLGLALPLVLVAIAIWTQSMARRSREFLQRAMEHSNWSDELHAVSLVDLNAQIAHRNQVDALSRPRRAWYGVMHRKYEFLARYPWLPAGGDPPRPE